VEDHDRLRQGMSVPRMSVPHAQHLSPAGVRRRRSDSRRETEDGLGT
jgi:hypothetical protein